MINEHEHKWTEKDFDTLTWHDNELHGIHLRNPLESYDFDLVLDIDHILEWIESPHGAFTFVVAPATLTFHQVTNLAWSLKLLYKERITISRICRDLLESGPNSETDLHSYRWDICLQPDASPASIISFEAIGFTQELTKPPVQTSRQYLIDDERR